jgi:hypothetical protein
MRRTLSAGLLLIAAAIVTIVLGSWLEAPIDSVFFGLTIGGILALVNDDSSTIGRLGGFAVGLVVTMAGYIIRILALNESLMGQILFVVIVLALIAAICSLTRGRMPLWSGLVGAALVAGSYEASFQAAPQDITTSLFSTVSTALVPMAIAFMAGILLKADLLPSGDDEKSDSSQVSSQPQQKSEV